MLLARVAGCEAGAALVALGKPEHLPARRQIGGDALEVVGACSEDMLWGMHEMHWGGVGGGL